MLEIKAAGLIDHTFLFNELLKLLSLNKGVDQIEKVVRKTQELSYDMKLTKKDVSNISKISTSSSKKADKTSKAIKSFKNEELFKLVKFLKNSILKLEQK